MTEEEFCSVVRLVESYVFRRAVCSIPTNSLNKTFSTFGRELRKDSYLESILAHFLVMPSYRRFPRDDEFKRELRVRDLYNFPRRSYLLRRLENHERKERVPVDEYTIEHIMPQNEDLSAKWRNDLGPEWERVHEALLHTLGNLTLTGYNSEYSDRALRRERDMEGGFRMSPLRLNETIASLERWDERAIQDRATRLADLAASVWGMFAYQRRSLPNTESSRSVGGLRPTRLRTTHTSLRRALSGRCSTYSGTKCSLSVQ